MIYNYVKERMKEIKKELSKDYKFYLYKLGKEVREGKMYTVILLILSVIVSFFNMAIAIISILLSLMAFTKMLYDANRFQNIYEREKLKEKVEK